MSREAERKRRAKHMHQIKEKDSHVSREQKLLYGRIWEAVVSSDAQDREIDTAHGFGPLDPYRPEALCRNGCGLTHGDIVAGKILLCQSEFHSATIQVERLIKEAFKFVAHSRNMRW